MSANILALIEALDRHGNVQARLPVTQWPVTVGRDLTADLVLDDPHVAALHLRLEQTTAGCLDVQVLDTHNGADLGAQHHDRNAQFSWSAGQPLALGRTHLQLRLADSPVPQEQPLPRWHWRTTAWTLAALSATLLLSLGQSWFKAVETSHFMRGVPATLLTMLGVLGIWAGLWALITKLFGQHAQFWRHVRIACAVVLALFAVETVLEVLAFMFSWEALVRFDHVVGLAVVAVALWRHLNVVAPRRQRVLGATAAVLLLLGVATLLGTQWLKSKRLSPQLYMNQLYPPTWRLAAPVSVPQFLQEAANIEQRLKARLDDKDNDDAGKSDTDDD
jgi:hypothetical protein